MTLRRNKLPRTDCHACGRDVAIRDGLLVRHYNPESRSLVDRICHGSHTSAYPDDAPNEDPPAFLGQVHPEPPLSGADELAAWWRMTAQAEIDMVVGKAVEYGATDLRDLGWQVLEMAGKKLRGESMFDDAYATEIGIAFYAAGKLARIMAAVKEGRRPSFDTWLDLGVYARMAQRVHTYGGWPAIQPALQVRRHRVTRLMTEEEAAEFEDKMRAMEPTLQRLRDGLKEI